MSDTEASAAPSPLGPIPRELVPGEEPKERLGPWNAAAICGNDTNSSRLSGSAIVAVEEISQELNVPKIDIFIGAPREKHRFSVKDLGGVRVIF